MQSCEISFEDLSRYFLKRSLSLEENAAGLEERCKSIGGSSGAFFYFTYDGLYILKTITDDETLVLQCMLEEYTQRVTDEGPSFFARIFGMFKIKVGHANNITVILMENLSAVMENPLRFDLKGSSVDRSATETEYVGFDSLPKTKVYKDTDFFNSMLHITVANNEFSNLLKTIKSDSKLLEKYSIMDYSLLMLIEKTKSLQMSMIQRNNYVKSEDFLICVGIIDFLQTYNTKKKLENKYKNLKKHESAGISAIPPKPYRKRFIRMIKNLFTLTVVN